MPKDSSKALIDAKQRLDKLIANARDQFFMPITIAEVLRKITEGVARVDEPDTLRKASFHWLASITRRLYRKEPSLNRSYWDKLYSSHMPPDALDALAKANIYGYGIAEAYVYARIRQTVQGLCRIRASLEAGTKGEFSLLTFLSAFEKDDKLKRSIDKAYEIVVHALFNAVATRVRAQVTLSISTADAAILADFQDFCKLLLGVDASNPTITVPACLYRVGGANSRDGGVDLWANFGPAVQVKHISLALAHAQPMVDSISAEQIVIVCKDAEKAVIETILAQVGMKDRVRGIITKANLSRWYDLALSSKHSAHMADTLFKSLLAEFDDEFPLTDPAEIQALADERGYDRVKLEGIWSVEHPVARQRKSPKQPPETKANKRKSK